MWLVATLLVPVGGALAQTGSLPLQSVPYDEGLKRYEICIERLPFRYHVDGWQQLSSSGDPRGLKPLVKDYAKPPSYTEYSRYVLATLFGQYYNAEESLLPFRGLRKSYKKPVDTWLWVQTLAHDAGRTDGTEVLQLAREGKNATQRAAAVAALGIARSRWLPAAITAVCADFPRKEAERNVLLGAMSGAIYDNKSFAHDDEFKPGLVAYINLLDEKVKLTHTAKVQVSRHLMWTLGGPALFDSPEPWLQLLERGQVSRPKSGNTVTKPRFFGIETEGERFCYVIDMSDSMCKKIHPSVRPKGPVTGSRGKPKKKPKGVLPDESDLPWHTIETRFDLAREQLKISLQRLPKDKYFSIVWFGSEAGSLDSCKGMVKATKGDVAKVIRELDSIETKSPTDIAPDGVLRGRTNMHAGLRRAFGLSRKGMVEHAAYVDPAALTQGCDTIFLLSDGDPSIDEFQVRAEDYGEGQVVKDQEYGEAAARTPMLHYPGPYVQPHWIVSDFVRMNAFRRIRMHCIGIGEANMGLLNQLADMGHGEVYVVGRKAQERTNPR